MTDEQLGEILRQYHEILSDHEKRLRYVERLLGFGFGGVGMLYFIAKAFKVI